MNGSPVGWRTAVVHGKNACEPDAIEKMPQDVGWCLLGGGLLTELGLPGVPPFWIFGLMVVWPRAGRWTERALQTRAPGLYRASTAWLYRYADDLQRRFPDTG